MVTVPQSQRLTQDKNEAINPPVENSEGSHSLSVQNEMFIQNRFKTETTNPSQLSQAEHTMNSFPSSIPVWVSVFCKNSTLFLRNLSSRIENTHPCKFGSVRLLISNFIVSKLWSYFMLGRQRWAAERLKKKKAGLVLYRTYLYSLVGLNSKPD